MTTKPAVYAGLIACSALVLVKGAQGDMMEGLVMGLATLVGTVLYASVVGRRLD
jgi:hypothetical protein